VAVPGDRRFRPFTTDEFAAPTNPQDWKYGSPDILVAPFDPDVGRRKLGDVNSQENPVVSMSLAVLSGGHPVRDLKAADLVVRDAGERQDIDSLTFATQPLDIVLLIDANPAMDPYIKRLKATALRSISGLRPQDRVGIVVFGEKQLLMLPLASNRDILVSAIQRIQSAAGGKDLNTAVAATAGWLRGHARPEATAAVVILTDNAGRQGIPDRVTRDALWRSGVIVSGLLTADDHPQEADVRTFIPVTGGEMLFMNRKELPLAEIFRRLHERYRLTYRAPGGLPNTIRTISVGLTPAAKTRFGDVTILAPGGYVVRDSGDGR
jgi:hypothetical protein